jgi:hypothetical protein
LEASDRPTFHICGRKLLSLLYTNVELKVTATRRLTRRDRFVKAFKDKMAYYLDNESLILEYGIAAFLDVR